MLRIFYALLALPRGFVLGRLMKLRGDQEGAGSSRPDRHDGGGSCGGKEGCGVLGIENHDETKDTSSTTSTKTASTDHGSNDEKHHDEAPEDERHHDEAEDERHHDGGGVERVKLRGKSGTEEVRLKCKGQGAEKKYTLSKIAKYYDLPCDFVGAGKEFTIEYTNDNSLLDGLQADVFVTEQYDNKEDNDRHKQPFLIKSEGTSFPSCPEYSTSGDKDGKRCAMIQDGYLAWKKVYTLKVKVRETERHHDEAPEDERHHDGGGVERVKLRGKSGTEEVRLKCKQGQGAEKKYTYTLSKTAKYYDLPCDFVGAGEEFAIEYTNDNFLGNGRQADVFVTEQYDNKEDNDRHKQPFLIKSEGTSSPSCPEYNTSGDQHGKRCAMMQDGHLAWKKVYTLKVKVRETAQ
eukprot:g6699.t1